jgi:mono/diheme cytochrome c family protein
MLDNNNNQDFSSLGNIPAVKRERTAETAQSNAPFWVVAVGAFLIAAGGVVIGGRSGGFSRDIFGPEQLYAGLSRVSSGDGAGAAQEKTLAELGKEIYANCQSCHQPTGQGVAGQFPSLVGTDYVVGSERRLVSILLKGIQGPLKVGDATYNGLMPAWESTLSDKKIAAVATYVRSAWGNAAPEISPEKVAVVRKELSSRTTPYTESELGQIPAGANIEGAAPGSVPVGSAPTAAPAQSVGGTPVSLEDGKTHYMAICVACHQPTGLGLAPVFPPVSESEYVNDSAERLVAIILKGVIGPITVKGTVYNNVMPGQEALLTDKKISEVASFVRANFGNKSAAITVDQVAEFRKKHLGKTTPWTESELKGFSADK